MDVDEARGNRETARVDLGCAAHSGTLRHGDDAAVRDDDVGLAAGGAETVEDGAVADDDVRVGARMENDCGRAEDERGGAGGFTQKIAAGWHAVKCHPREPKASRGSALYGDHKSRSSTPLR